MNSILSSLGIHVSNPVRTFTVHTGISGLKNFDTAMKRAAIESYLELHKKKFKPDEYSRLQQIINSPDIENLAIVEAVIDVKKTSKIRRYVSNIQNRKSHLHKSRS